MNINSIANTNYGGLYSRQPAQQADSVSQVRVGGPNHFSSEPSGDIVKLQRSHPQHFGPRPVQVHAQKEPHVAGDFASFLSKAMDTVNAEQVHSDKLARQLAFDPKSVDAHTVMIAAEKARISLTFTKTVVDQTVRAYRELINMR